MQELGVLELLSAELAGKGSGALRGIGRLHLRTCDQYDQSSRVGTGPTMELTNGDRITSAGDHQTDGPTMELDGVDPPNDLVFNWVFSKLILEQEQEHD